MLRIDASKPNFTETIVNMGNDFEDCKGGKNKFSILSWLEDGAGHVIIGRLEILKAVEKATEDARRNYSYLW